MASAKRVQLIGEPVVLAGGGREALGDHLTRPGLQLTVVYIQPRLPCVSSWAPLSGLVTRSQMQRDCLNDAECLARELVAALPADLQVTHCVAACLRDALELAADHDVVVTAGSLRQRDRRQARAKVSLAQHG